MYRVGIVGAGKAGVSIGLYFFNTDVFFLSGYYSRSLESAKYACELTNSKKFNSLEEVVCGSDVLIIATPDDVVSEVWKEICPLDLRDKIICHLSGSLSSKIFSDISQKGAHGCSLHPLMAISSKEFSHRDMDKTFFTLEGDKKALEVIEKLLKSKGNQYKIMEAEDKTKYHLASVFFSNLVLALGNISLSLLYEYGFKENEALSAFQGLASLNLKNFFEKGFSDSITGPVERNDVYTVKNHLRAISDCKDIEDVYRLLSLEVLKVAEKKHKDRDYGELKALLRKENNS